MWSVPVVVSGGVLEVAGTEDNASILLVTDGVR